MQDFSHSSCLPFYKYAFIEPPNLRSESIVKAVPGKDYDLHRQKKTIMIMKMNLRTVTDHLMDQERNSIRTTRILKMAEVILLNPLIVHQMFPGS